MKRRKMRKVLVFGIVLVLAAVMFAAVPMNVNAEGTGDLQIDTLSFPKLKGTVHGTGKYFEITDSEYLNVKMTSSETVYVALESVPNVLSYSIEANCTSNSTQITLVGLEVNKTYYRYQEGHLQEEFLTDKTGSYLYIQDLTISHHISIQEETSTLYIRDDATGGDGSSIGNWDWPTKTLILTTDVYETINIEDDGITLDGDGYSITRQSGNVGIGTYGRTGLTIKNVAVIGFTYGIRLWGAIDCIVSGSTVTDNWYHGIALGGLYYSPCYGNTVIGNTITNSDYGVAVWHSSNNNVIKGNTISWTWTSRYGHVGIDVFISNSNTLTGNSILGIFEGGFWVKGGSSFNTLSGNTITGTVLTYGSIAIWGGSNFNTVIDNQIDGNPDPDGIMISGCNGCTVTGNTVSNNGRNGIYIYNSLNIVISENTISNNINTGINLLSSSTNLIYHNNIINNGKSAYDNKPLYNDWHHPDLLEGNYWSDYFGVDDGSGTGKHTIAKDGIGDTLIPHPGANYDNYPFTSKIVKNEPPVIKSISGPFDPVAIDTSFTMTGIFTDPDTDDIHTATWTWGDGESSTGIVDQVDDTISGSHDYNTPGVYTISLEVIDSFDESDTTTWQQYIVVYDPTGAFITGGGLIDSPEGAYLSNPSLTGKAGFGFVSKYQKGTTVPNGNTQFRFHAADIQFKSESYDWLVVTGHKGMFKGTGTNNGAGNYGFILSAIDAELTPSIEVDLFRIKIWDKDTGKTFYDNGLGTTDDTDPSTELIYGSIKIHKV